MKKFFNILFSIILIILLMFLFVSLGIKKIVINTLSETFTSKEVSDYVMDYVFLEYQDVDSDKLLQIQNAIRNNDEINEITAKYYDTLINDIKNNTTSKVDVSNEINTLIDNVLVNNNNIDISSSQIEKIKNEVNDSNLNKIYNSVLRSVNNNMNSKTEQIINVYTIFIKNTTRIILISIILLIFLILLFINGVIKSFKYLGISLIISGILSTFGIPFMMHIFENYLSNNLLGRTTTINISSMTFIGIISIIIGIFLTGTYIIFRKKES